MNEENVLRGVSSGARETVTFVGDADLPPHTEPAPVAGSALTRLLQILDLFTIDRMTVHVDEVIQQFELGQSTAYRYLRELSDAGLITNRGKGRYALGRRIVELERLLQLSDPLLLAGKPILDSLEPDSQNRAFLLCTPYNSRVLCVYKVGASEITGKNSKMAIERGRGTSFTLFRGAGSQAILAHMAPHQLKSAFLTSPDEIDLSGLGKTWKEFRSSLLEIRKQGYAQTVGRTNPGMYSLAVPVLTDQGKVLGSVLMLGAKHQRDAGMALLPKMAAKATEIAAAFGQAE